MQETLCPCDMFAFAVKNVFTVWRFCFPCLETVFDMNIFVLILMQIGIYFSQWLIKIGCVSTENMQ